MHAAAAAQLAPPAEKLTFRRILLESLRLYRAQCPLLLAAFLVPAAARCLWTVAQFSFIRYRHPEWPVAGLLINGDWGLNLYWSSIALTWCGWFLYAVLFGPALAVASRVALDSALLKNAPTLSTPPARVLLRTVRLQFRCILRAWAVFIGGLLATVLVGATLLTSNTDTAFLLWYALVILTFGAGLPIGIRLSLRYALTVPAAINETFPFADALKRSIQMTRRAQRPLFVAVSSILIVRLALGIGFACGLGLLAQSFPAAAPVSTFLLLPLARCLLDSFSGPLLGATLASLYAQKAASELCPQPRFS